MNEQTEVKKGNKWDAYLEKVEALGPWVLVVTEGGKDKSSGGIHILRPKKETFSRVISVGPDVKKIPIKIGDRIIFREGFNAMPKDYESLPSKTYTFVFEPNIIGLIPDDTDVPDLL